MEKEITIGEVLKTLRIKNAFTIEDVVEKLHEDGVDQRTIKKWEKGTSYPNVSQLGHLADFYQEDIRNLLVIRQKTIDSRMESIHKNGIETFTSMLAKARPMLIVIFIIALALLWFFAIVPNVRIKILFWDGS